MPVDMFPARFLDELRRVKRFRRYGEHDADIQMASLPPKQAFLPGLFLFNHAAGYRLPEWEQFRNYYLSAVHKHKNFHKFKSCFIDGEPKPGLLWRMSGWYEDSMAHAFLYSMLVLAYEDIDQSAFVLYDARADWKFKADLVIMRASSILTGVRISMYGQSDEARAIVEAQRDSHERITKRNAADSSHWKNATYKALPCVPVSRAATTPIIENGFCLFNANAIERLMRDIDSELGCPRNKLLPVNQMLVYRP